MLTGILSFQILPHLLVEVEETIETSWRQGKAQDKGSRLEVVKEMVRSIIMWFVAVLADPKRVIDRIAKR